MVIAIFCLISFLNQSFSFAAFSFDPIFSKNDRRSCCFGCICSCSGCFTSSCSCMVCVVIVIVVIGVAFVVVCVVVVVGGAFRSKNFGARSHAIIAPKNDRKNHRDLCFSFSKTIFTSIRIC